MKPRYVARADGLHHARKRWYVFDKTSQTNHDICSTREIARAKAKELNAKTYVTVPIVTEEPLEPAQSDRVSLPRPSLAS